MLKKIALLGILLLLLSSPAWGASAKVAPTTGNGGVSTMGQEGKDYGISQFTAWEEATDLNCSGTNSSYFLDIYSGATIPLAWDYMDGATTSADYHRVVRAATGHGNDGVASLNGTTGYPVCFASTSQFGIIQVKENYSQLWDLVGTNNCSDAATRYTWKCDNTGNTFVNMIAVDSTNGVGLMEGFYMAGGTTAFNCAAVNIGDDGFLGFNGTVWINCTSVNNGDNGFNAGAASVVAKNLLATGNAGSDYVNTGNFTTTTCGSEDATSPTVALRGQTYAFTGDYDFTLTSDSDGIGDATDLSTTFDDDVEGETRVAWDLGFDEYIAGGGAVVKKKSQLIIIN